MEIKNLLIKKIEFYRQNIYPNLEKSPNFCGDIDYFIKCFSNLKSFKWMKSFFKITTLTHYVYADKFIDKYKNKLLGELIIEPFSVRNYNYNITLLFQINTKLFAGMLVGIAEDSKTEYVPVGNVFCLFDDYKNFIPFYDDTLKLAYFPNQNNMGFFNTKESSDKIIADLLSKFNKDNSDLESKNIKD